MAEMTPMMRQYRQIKEQNPDCILVFPAGRIFTRCSTRTPAPPPGSLT